ncbi:hypothetical protein [Rhodopseudomonas pseudopalustris]|uniref:Lipoprotein n=2 Tax=Rhodopseudomonas TaxID=1073 RepID=Q131C7_RHOPS|nr:hypothetical protein [Rhodopseudomonas pseudopalustris]ABE41312.1 hypothetical protein RPD_4093 [Rhodopseudomonas palustris BisB5]MBB1094062.1 hypothetical protein [Rhodopseudomonas palustris]SEO02458.1 hypothetical protein SAMN05444123_1013 [Rhodopseudomonas pseudopalustris]
MGGLIRSGFRSVATVVLVVAASALTGCVFVTDGPKRLYPVDVEAEMVRQAIGRLDLSRLANSAADRNAFIAARMYAIDMQYTAYESALTRERQNVGFGAAAATLGLTTASGLLAPVATKNILTGAAGFITGTRAAYDNDVLLAQSVQWIQSQMRAKRGEIYGRIVSGMQLSTSEYPLAAALSDLEAYYRAGTFTGGMLSTSEVLAADAQAVEEEKRESITVTYGSTSSTVALRACLMNPDVKEDDLIALTKPPTPRAFARLLVDASGAAETRRNNLLGKARQAGICR